MNTSFLKARGLSRRDVLRAGAGMTAAALGTLGAGSAFSRAARALAPGSGKILVVLEMSGGNDGLNTVVPHGDDAYYRQRPTIGLKPGSLIPIDDMFGFNPGLIGFEKLYKDGDFAIVHGAGYDDPSFSHFTSMAYWHTAAPNSGAEYGWVGRLADVMKPGGAPNYVVNIDATQSLAVRSRDHVPVVFDDPAGFRREGFYQQQDMFRHTVDAGDSANDSRRFLHDIARSALDASALVREAWAAYATPIDYGLVPLDLPKIASLIAADLPARLYYTSFRNNAFDTHVHQGNLHRRLLTYTADAVSGFFADMERLGRADDVVMMAFSEFGRRVPENTSLGTDHGAAGPMFLIGKPVRGGHYGEPPSLVELDDGDNLIHTVDFRRVYATAIEGWLDFDGADDVLGGRFAPLPVFG